MFRKLPKATAEQIQESMMKFIGAGTTSSFAFRLLCKFCRDLGIITTTASGINSPREKVKASIKFSEQGWRIDEHELVCPKCYKYKS